MFRLAAILGHMLKVLDQITFLTTRLISTFLFEIFLPIGSYFSHLHPKLDTYEEIIKNVSNNSQSVVTTLNKQ